MDGERLADLFQVDRARKYWLKPTGIPEQPPDTHATFVNRQEPVEFNRRPASVKPGDILVVYRIGVSKVTFIGECLAEPDRFNARELAEQPWRERWPWYLEIRNHTPEFGSCWSYYELQPFPLSREYHLANPHDQQRLEGIKAGHDKVQISRGFAEFIAAKISALDPR